MSLSCIRLHIILTIILIIASLCTCANECSVSSTNCGFHRNENSHDDDEENIHKPDSEGCVWLMRFDYSNFGFDFDCQPPLPHHWSTPFGNNFLVTHHT